MAMLLTAILFSPLPAEAAYRYAHSASEYTVDLPEAPTATTIWAEDGNIPYLDVAPKYGAAGETALFKRTDVRSGDFIEIKITFLKADRDFLLNLTEEKMKAALESDYKDIRLDNKKFSFTTGTDTLKWATLEGFAVDRNNSLLYHTTHYLTGQDSVFVLKATYNIEKKEYTDVYKSIVDSIKFRGQ
jgi:hypothetical protein